MAHVGRFYPLANRRDLCNSVPNHNRSWPKAFNVNAAVARIVPPFQNQVLPQILAPQWGDEWGDQIEYRSAPYLVFGKLAHWRIKQINYNKPDHFQYVRFELWSDHSVGWSLNNNFNGARCDILNYSSTFGLASISEPDLDWWGAASVSWQIFAGAAGWPPS